MLENRMNWRDFVDPYKGDPGQQNPASQEVPKQGQGFGIPLPWIKKGAGAVGGVAGTLAGSALAGGGGNDSTVTPEVQAVIDQLQQKSTGKNAAASGDALQQFAQYFKQLIGGDPAQMLAATAADRGRVIDQYDTARRSSAEFGARGGGSTSASALSRVAQANQLSDTTATARSTAATQGAGVAQALAQLGISEDQLQSMDLNAIMSAILNSDQIDANRDANKSNVIGGMAEGVGTLLGLYLTRGKAA